MSRKFIVLLFIGLLVFSVCCNKDSRSKPKSYTQIKVDVDIPPIPTGGYEFYVFNDCKGTVHDVKGRVFHNNPGDFKIFDAAYGKNDAKAVLEKQKFKSVSAKFREWPGTIYYKGGRMDDPLTYSGSADIVIHYVTNIGWFRVR